MAKDIGELIKKYETSLRTSPTAYQARTSPTSEELSTERSLRKLKGQQERERGEQLKEQWYPERMEGKRRESGAIDKILHTLGTPLYATVGAVEHALGKGSKKGLLANVKANIAERGTYGDLMRSYGAPGYLATPLGFMLDIAGDPLAWITMGTGSLVPRVGAGLLKGGATGAALGATSRFAELGATVTKAGRLVPGLRHKIATGAEGVVPTAMRKLEEKMAATAGRQVGKYERAIDFNMDDFLKSSHVVEKAVSSIGRMAKRAGLTRDNLSRTSGGRAMLKMFDYSPNEWFKKALARYKELRAQRAAARGQEGAQSLFGAPPVTMASDILGVERKDVITRELAESLDAMMLPELSRTLDSLEVCYRNMGEAQKDDLLSERFWDEIADISRSLTKKGGKGLVRFGELDDKARDQYVRMFTTMRSEVEKYDDFVAQRLLDSKFRKTMATYAQFLGLFKTAKIGGNLSTAGTYATVGNLAMSSMAGVDIANPGFFNSMSHAVNIMRGKLDDDVMRIFQRSDWADTLEEASGIMQAITGINPNILRWGDEYVKQVATEAAAIAQKAGGNMDEFSKYLKESTDIIDKAKLRVAKKMAEEGKLRGVLGKKDTSFFEDALKGTPEVRRQLMSAVEASLPGGERSTLLLDEVIHGEMGHLIKRVKRAADRGSMSAKAAHWYLTKPMDYYSKIDQTNKLGLMLHLTENGLSTKELNLLKNRFAVGVDDVQRVGQKFKFTPMKAMQAANEIYMNYAAMPGFVKIMRSMPILGAPFLSFAYGMTALTGKTLVHNPAFFNKVNFLLQEISGRKSPLEKEALDSKYYEWLDRPGFVKVPFFQDNPLYLNMENMLPHYTMSFLQAPERSYKDRYGDEVVKIIDQVPFLLKDPAGQVLLDYLILPAALGEAQGVFGQPLWTKDAGLPEKLGRAASATTEAVVPGMAGFGALIPGELPIGATSYLPSYRFRQLEHALRGRTSTGVPAKEPAAQRTARVISAMAGWPVYQMNLTYSAGKKSKKKSK